MHVFTNVSEYLIVIIPLSSALRRLSVSKAELPRVVTVIVTSKSCMIIYFEVVFFGRSALFQVTEDKFQG